MKIHVLSFILATLVAFTSPQQRIKSGDLKGFTSSPTEHVIREIDKPIILGAVEGIVVMNPPPGGLMTGPLVGALFEIRGPDGDESIRGTRADRLGRFRIKNVKQGRYKFKVTLNGFQSIVGTIIVSEEVDDNPFPAFVMHLGE